ncbi:MAG: single-stranded DNA-binding protein [Bacteroidota bacterium]
MLHNLVQLAGRISQPMEIRLLSDGTAYTHFWLYQDERDQSGKAVSHTFPVAVWGTLAQALSLKVRRGDRLLVQGKLRTAPFSKTSNLGIEVQLTSFHLLQRPSREQGRGKMTTKHQKLTRT